MRKLKTILCFTLVFCVLLSVAGCGKNKFDFGKLKKTCEELDFQECNDIDVAMVFTEKAIKEDNREDYVGFYGEDYDESVMKFLEPAGGTFITDENVKINVMGSRYDDDGFIAFLFEFDSKKIAEDYFEEVTEKREKARNNDPEKGDNYYIDCTRNSTGGFNEYEAIYLSGEKVLVLRGVYYKAKPANKAFDMFFKDWEIVYPTEA